MAELKCTAENCTYNCESYCSKGDILVGESMQGYQTQVTCDSFREKGMVDSFSSSLEHPCETISIDCEADKCIFNSNYKCVAKQGDIKGLGSGSAQCATYQASN